jgi:hypothetical protein
MEKIDDQHKFSVLTQILRHDSRVPAYCAKLTKAIEQHTPEQVFAMYSQDMLTHFEKRIM